MQIIAVDDERLAVENMIGLLRKIVPDAEITGFSESAKAFAYMAENKVDIAFLDIELGALSGIELAERCKELCPDINIIFVTGYTKYMMDAFKLHVSGYLMKPVRESELRAEMENLRHPIPQKSGPKVRIQTFGFFEIFVDERPLKFTRTKCKECLAYLVDRRGARVTFPTLSAVLWEDRPFNRTVQNNTQKVISDLMKSLKEAGIQELIIKSRQDIAVDTAFAECDYYGALNGDVLQSMAFNGEYMSNYSWAEFTLGEILENRRI